MKGLEKYLENQCLTPDHKYILKVFDSISVQTFGHEDCPYYLASCSKTIIGFILFKLLKSNKEDVVKRFNLYLAELDVSTTLSVYDFLRHSTNIPDYLNYYDVNHGKKASDIFKDFVIGREITSTSFNYSNTNYVILYEFLKKLYNFPYLLKELNLEIREKFELFGNQLIFSIPNIYTRGKLNQVFGDGGFVFNPKDQNQNNSPFMCLFYQLIESNLNLFIEGGVDVDNDTLYSFGCFYCKRTRKIYHSGFYNNNIAYWEICPSYKGVFFCVNFTSIEKEKIDELLSY